MQVGDFFIYQASYGTAIAPGTSSSAVLNIGTDADFVVDQVLPSFELQAALSSHIAGTPLPLGPVTSGTAATTLPCLNNVLIKIMQEGKAWDNTNNGVPASNFVSTNGPAFLQTKKVLKAGESLNITVTNSTTVATLLGEICFIGRKVSKTPA